ncbi:MAG TPA: transposase [Candidatus Tectomicrobia bacterium]|jgi:IS605 OrfB family transposase
MQIRRTITIIIAPDADLRATLDAFRQVCQTLSPVCYNNGNPLRPITLQRQCYHQVKGTLNAQMTITAMRRVSGAYTSARRNKRLATAPFAFTRQAAIFLVGPRGRDADFRADGTLSIWTVAGRKRLTYRVPEAFKARLEQASEIDSLTVIERGGRLLGRVALTLAVPEPQGLHPVGIDLNETNALVAMDADDRTLFVSGKAVKVANRRTFRTRKRLQRKLATHKAERQDTRSVRRLLKRLGRQRSNRTRTFAQTAAKQVVTWAPPQSILVFEDLHIPQPRKGHIRGKALRRRLSQWQHEQIRHYARCRAEERGMTVATVDPAYTSTTCSRCGALGKRKRHWFSCPACGFTAHADVNAAKNIRNRFVVLRYDGLPSISPEALSSEEGKLPPDREAVGGSR